MHIKLRTKLADNFLFPLSVEWLIVDESDKLFETGKNGFRDQVPFFKIAFKNRFNIFYCSSTPLASFNNSSSTCQL